MENILMETPLDRIRRLENSIVKLQEFINGKNAEVNRNILRIPNQDYSRK